jgi:hypothetical protein
MDQILRVPHREEKRGGEPLATPHQPRVGVHEAREASEKLFGLGRAHGGMIPHGALAEERTAVPISRRRRKSIGPRRLPALAGTLPLGYLRAVMRPHRAWPRG